MRSKIQYQPRSDEPALACKILAKRYVAGARISSQRSRKAFQTLLTRVAYPEQNRLIGDTAF